MLQMILKVMMHFFGNTRKIQVLRKMLELASDNIYISLRLSKVRENLIIIDKRDINNFFLAYR